MNASKARLLCVWFQCVPRCSSTIESEMGDVSQLPTGREGSIPWEDNAIPWGDNTSAVRLEHIRDRNGGIGPQPVESHDR
jgi:hypothetical protein